MAARIAKIPYLNSAPFYHRLGGADLEFREMPPAPMGEAARRGEIEAGPLSLLDYHSLSADFGPVGDWIIGVKRSAGSVLLFSRVPPEELTDSSTVGVTSESTTGAMLCRVILMERFGVLPEYSREAVAPDATLLIGDAALSTAHRGFPEHPHVLDLGEAWWEWHHLPFVFAVWAVRRGEAATGLKGLAGRLEASVAAWTGEPDPDGLYRPWSERLDIPAPKLKAYIDGFVYRRGPDEDEAVEIFGMCLKRLKEAQARVVTPRPG